MIDFAKVNAALDEMAKNTSDPDVLRGVQGLKEEVRLISAEAEKVVEENKRLDEENHKLVDSLKKEVLGAGSATKPGEANPGSPNPKVRSFEEILAEKAEKLKAEKK